MKRNLKRLAIRVLGEDRFQDWAGVFDYRFSPELQGLFGGPLNGSIIRQSMVEALLRAHSLRAIVETGTFRGDTTEFFAATGILVFSVEMERRFHSFARTRLRKQSNVHLSLGDSRSFLRQLSRDDSVPKRDVLFYLDAHWNSDLPLREELELIFDHWTDFIVVVDDFKVPDDPGYGFENYGDGRVLCLEYLCPFSHRGIRVFFPRAASSEEVGGKRGWVVLAQDQIVAERLGGLPQLREWTAPLS
jgi:hypothetical protein